MKSKPFSIVDNLQNELPNNIEAEQAVLGSILVSNEIFDRYGNIAARIAPSIFSGDPEITKELIYALKKQL